MKAAQVLIREARNAAQAVAEGPFTPVVFEQVETFGGRVWLIGGPSQTQDGHSCIVWTSKAAQ